MLSKSTPLKTKTPITIRAVIWNGALSLVLALLLMPFNCINTLHALKKQLKASKPIIETKCYLYSNNLMNVVYFEVTPKQSEFSSEDLVNYKLYLKADKKISGMKVSVIEYGTTFTNGFTIIKFDRIKQVSDIKYRLAMPVKGIDLRESYFNSENSLNEERLTPSNDFLKHTEIENFLTTK